ncbi:hypothetical protein V8C26DRAFT_429765 [Trichoderma gracile]
MPSSNGITAAAQRRLQHETAPAPLGTVGFIRGSYIGHLREWLRSQSLCWHPSMLASKLGADIERQIVREQKPRDVANLMRLVTGLHAEIVDRGGSTHRDPHRVWRDVLQFANPAFVDMWPRFGEMLEEARREVVVAVDDFLEEFDQFVKEKELNSKVVVLMNCPDCERWEQQNFH